jgi:hypothetical protein
MRRAVNDALDETLPGQHVGLDTKPNIIQQEQKRALIYDTAAHGDLREFPPAMLGNSATPGAVIPVETDQSGTRIDVQLIDAAMTPGESPSRERSS